VSTNPDVIDNDMESHYVINISDYRTDVMYSEHEVQDFPKQLKHLKITICQNAEKVIH